MRIFCILILLLCAACKMSAGNSDRTEQVVDSNNQTINSGSSQEGTVCELCQTRLGLQELKYEFEWIVCSDVCPLAEDGFGIDEDCDRECIAERSENMREASELCLIENRCELEGEEAEEEELLAE